MLIYTEKRKYFFEFKINWGICLPLWAKWGNMTFVLESLSYFFARWINVNTLISDKQYESCLIGQERAHKGVTVGAWSKQMKEWMNKWIYEKCQILGTFNKIKIRLQVPFVKTCANCLIEKDVNASKKIFSLSNFIVWSFLLFTIH